MRATQYTPSPDQMRTMMPEAVVGAQRIVILGAQGARLRPVPDEGQTAIYTGDDPEFERVLAEAGEQRTDIGATLISKNKGAEGYVFMLGGHGELSGGGRAPRTDRETESFAHRHRLVATLGRLGIGGREHNWTFVPNPIERDARDPRKFNPKLYAGTLAQEAVKVVEAVQQVAPGGVLGPESVHVIASPDQLLRFGLIVNALAGVSLDTFVGVPNLQEKDSLKETVTRLLYRALVTRGQRDVLAKTLIRREQTYIKPIAAVFNAPATAKALLKRVASLSRAQTPQVARG